MFNRAKYMREYRRTHPWYREKQEIIKLNWYKNHPGKKRDENKRYHRAYRVENQRLKEIILSHYGVNGIAQCQCCGESHIEFLTIDHINGDGAEHRRKIGTNHMYKWLKRNHFPEGFRTLCWNCNCSLGKFGYCPHGNVKKENREIQETIPPLLRLVGGVR